MWYTLVNIKQSNNKGDNTMRTITIITNSEQNTNPDMIAEFLENKGYEDVTMAVEEMDIMGLDRITLTGDKDLYEHLKDYFNRETGMIIAY